MLRFNCFRFARPKPRSWKKPSSSTTHFTYVSERDINQGKTAESVAKEKHTQQQQQQHQTQQQTQYEATSDASAAAGKYGNSIFSLLHHINPTRNVDLVSKKPWLRRGVVWAQTVKLTEFGHISNYLAPAYIGTGFACTVAVVRESCDTLALQVPFIPIHLALLHLLTIWSVTCCGGLLQAMAARWKGDKSVNLTFFDGVGAGFVHVGCGVILLLGHHWAALEVAAVGFPIIALNLYFQTRNDYYARLKKEELQKQQQQNMAAANISPKEALQKQQRKQRLANNKDSSSVISKVMKEDVIGDAEKSSNSEDTTATTEKSSSESSSSSILSYEPSRLSMFVSACTIPIPMLMGYASLLGRIDPTVMIPVALTGVCWGLMYHTFRGGNTLFFSWGGRKRIKVQLFGLSAASYTLLNIAGVAAGQTLFYYAFLAWAWYHMLGVIDHFRPNDAWSIATAQKRMRSSMWLVFLAVCAGNLLWLLLVAAVAEIREVDPEDEVKLIEHAEPIPEEKKKTTKSSVLAQMLTLTVTPTGYTSMDQFSWADRMVKPILVYASVQKHGAHHHEQQKESDGAENKVEASHQQDGKKKGGGANKKVDDPKRTVGDATSILADLEIPVYYRREYFGENVVFFLGKSGLVSQENVDKFEHKYLSFVDHYSPYGAI